MRNINIIIWITCLILSPLPTVANTSAQTQTDKTIQKLYHTLGTKPTPMPIRLNKVSRYFLDTPYQNNALGEGPNATYDQDPLYRSDFFDCETYVDTVLAIALALAPDFNAFTQCMNHIRYQNGHVSFTKRNHFTSLDWNTNNQKMGILKDVTHDLLDENQQPVAKTSTTLINKPNWYANLPASRIRLKNASSKTKSQRLKALQQEGSAFSTHTVHTPYIPLTALFNTKGHPNYALFNQIPHGAIIEIVRPNWNLEAQIGSRLDISHMGFAFRKHGRLYFRNASTITQKVSDIPLISYLKKTRSSPTIRGINIQVLIPNAPSVDFCPKKLSLLN